MNSTESSVNPQKRALSPVSTLVRQKSKQPCQKCEGTGMVKQPIQRDPITGTCYARAPRPCDKCEARGEVVVPGWQNR